MGMQGEIAFIEVIQAVTTMVIIVLTYISSQSEKRRKKEETNAKARADIRAKESGLAMRLAYSNAKLSVAIAMALKEGKTNGTMEKALAETDAVQADYEKFLLDAVTRSA